MNSDLVVTCQHLVTSQEEQVLQLVFCQVMLLIQLFLLELPDGSFTRCKQQHSYICAPERVVVPNDDEKAFKFAIINTVSDYYIVYFVGAYILLPMFFLDK